MLSLFKRKEHSAITSTAEPQVLTIWSPAGLNTAQFSLELGQELSRYTKVAIAELPCLGIPRLGFISSIIERENCTEAALQELEKKGELTLNQLQVKEDGLAILPASVYATPDYPLIDRLSLQTLIDYPAKFTNAARQLGYRTILFECQGQLTSPMTFFALKSADRILLIVTEAAELAFTLINVKRLVQIFKFPVEKFCLVGEMDPSVLEEIALLRDDEGNLIGRLAVTTKESKKVLELLWPGISQQVHGSEKVKTSELFDRKEPSVDEEQLEQEIKMIKL